MGDEFSMDELLLALLKQGAYFKPVKITTTELGKMLEMSQQNVSHRLSVLEKEDMVNRTASGIELTKKAKDRVDVLYADMKLIFEKEKLELSGVIVSGLGEGKYYLSMDGYRKQVKEKFGYLPFPGTLNIEIDENDMWKKQHILKMEPIIITGFKDKNRSYGDLFGYKCRIGDIDCAIIVPLRTHHGPRIIEIISRVELKKRLGKKDGDRIKVVF
jgi:riboflavin kinase